MTGLTPPPRYQLKFHLKFKSVCNFIFRTMETGCRRIIFFIFWMHLSCTQIFFKTNAQDECTGNGLKECACNFIKACAWNDFKEKFEAFRGSSEASLKPFLPDALHVLAKNPKKIAMICEPGSIGIFYDCENRIPIAATIVITSAQYDSSYTRMGRFRLSSKIPRELQQKKKDYKKATDRIPCYKSLGSTTLFIEPNWYKYVLGKRTLIPRQPCVGVPDSPIDRGHLIAAHYGLGKINNRIRETFVYTNAVPQFSKLNRGAWNQLEGKVIQWARDNCNRAPIHIIVGSVPSTFGTINPRFFGKPGFSDYLSDFDGYRVNVPAYIWTAACCYSPGKFTKSTFYLAKNAPGMHLGMAKEFSKLFFSIPGYFGSANKIKLFPKWPDCHDDRNFVKIV